MTMDCLKITMLLLFMTFFGSVTSLLFHGNNDPTTPTPIGPLGLETTVSLLAKEVTRLQTDMQTQEAKMKNQEDEISHLKTLLSESNATTESTSNHFLDELNSLKSTVATIKTDLDLFNSAAGIQAVLLKLNSMAHSIRYLTISLQDQQTNLEATNNSLHQDILLLRTKVEAQTRDTAGLKYIENSNFLQIQSQISGVQSSVHSLQTKTSSLQSHVNSLESTSSSQQTSIRGLQTESRQFSSSITSVKSTLVDYFRHFVMDGFYNGHLASALQYGGTRLVGGSSYSGRVEISINGVWGTVCDDSFDSNDNAAKVVCRSLGKPWHYAEHRSSSVYGQGDESMMILLDGVNCNGNEGNIAGCSHGQYGRHDCSHSEDVGVICK